ncbi:hypothetical protein T12_946 [Trichinella patagoniensis]|uniref:Uncharacterized protein n=1 Tax=Trichinella patagoniensis TaxID=990121 RepID=A0A0V0Z8V5_9BILA|nr:hypothetical protein T12_946 [Trichinella patagoniensis]
MARSARSYSRRRSRSSTRRSMSSRRGSLTRPRRRSISRSQTPKRSTHQILVPSSRLKLQKRPLAVQLYGVVTVTFEIEEYYKEEEPWQEIYTVLVVDKKYATKHWTVGYSLFSSNRLTAELKTRYHANEYTCV